MYVPETNYKNKILISSNKCIKNKNAKILFMNIYFISLVPRIDQTLNCPMEPTPS
jgi:hypothetical protein